MATIDEFLFGITSERRQEPPGEDLLSLLMGMRDEETGEGMSEKQRRDDGIGGAGLGPASGQR